MNIKILLFSLIFFASISNLKLQAQSYAPDEGKGLVVFYRTKAFSGGAIKFSVKDSDKSYGQLTNGSIIKINVAPGEHTFWSQVISSDAISLTVEEGKVYFIKGTVKMGALAGRPKFQIIEEKKALKEIKKI